MMKKLLAIIFINLILIMMLFTFSGCGSNVNKEENVNNTNESNQSDGEETLADDDNQLYFKVLENEIKYVNEDNNETLFKTYMENYKENSLVEQCISRLEIEIRLAALLYFYIGLNEKEISKLLRISEHETKKKIDKARTELNSILFNE